jgi:hypothetical protein
MLHCNMTTTTNSLQLALEDIVGDLTHARRTGDLGRVALLAYCGLRRWARVTRRRQLAERADALIVNAPFADRAGFLKQVDALIGEAEQTLRAMTQETSPGPSPSATTPRQSPYRER